MCKRAQEEIGSRGDSLSAEHMNGLLWYNKERSKRAVFTSDFHSTVLSCSLHWQSFGSNTTLPALFPLSLISPRL